jgi:hypothetical protein
MKITRPRIRLPPMMNSANPSITWPAASVPVWPCADDQLGGRHVQRQPQQQRGQKDRRKGREIQRRSMNSVTVSIRIASAKGQRQGRCPGSMAEDRQDHHHDHRHQHVIRWPAGPSDGRRQGGRGGIDRTSDRFSISWCSDQGSSRPFAVPVQRSSASAGRIRSKRTLLRGISRSTPRILSGSGPD